ncbi:PREDICTED: interleukin-13 receptor subunit alpha-2-like [Nanorana parkeri]|uniref:interleukin-13 receptor subunit alpha-2-like n=1 Tax=Nanorana parkeri TaxID=125878 RepID=UPI000854544A|nr:PREDICTED: interleukin-13 receptor subunit alpha-2-like [Nanorana parkeri]
MWNQNCRTGHNMVRSIIFQCLSGIMVYLIVNAKWATTSVMNVHPPSNVRVDDLGYLGIMNITWEPPVSLNSSHCTARYELQHYDANEQRWKSVRTKQQTYSAAFNLGKDIVIKIRTYLKGACTDDKEVWSKWIQINESIPMQGDPESSVQDFYCIYYKFETLRCEWKAGKVSNSNYKLQYWQEGMAEKNTCDHYLKTKGINTGCIFGRQELQLFSNLFICVTGIPGMDPIRPSYFMFQLQNIGKPGAPEDVNISKSQGDEFILDWWPPSGKIPAHCLEYEIQYKDQTDTWKTIAEHRETTHSFNISTPSPRFCVRIHGKTTKYCTDDGYWSDWSTESCWEVGKSSDHSSSPYSSFLLHKLGISYEGV